MRKYLCLALKRLPQLSGNKGVGTLQEVAFLCGRQSWASTEAGCSFLRKSPVNPGRPRRVSATLRQGPHFALIPMCLQCPTLQGSSLNTSPPRREGSEGLDPTLSSDPTVQMHHTCPLTEAHSGPLPALCFALPVPLALPLKPSALRRGSPWKELVKAIRKPRPAREGISSCHTSPLI